jgi:hypothetical protein
MRGRELNGLCDVLDWMQCRLRQAIHWLLNALQLPNSIPDAAATAPDAHLTTCLCNMFLTQLVHNVPFVRGCVLLH